MRREFSRVLLIVLPALLAACSSSEPSAPRSTDAGQVAEMLPVRILPAYEGKKMIGAYFHQLEESSALAEAGLRPGDVIVSYNGIPFTEAPLVQGFVINLMNGGRIELEVLQDNGERATIVAESSGCLHCKRD